MKQALYLALYTLAGALVVLAGAACSGTSSEVKPPAIVYGQDVCEECGMIISDAKYAAATIDTQGSAHKFDDVGGMILFHMNHPTSQVRAWFVHDYNTQAWLRGETAYYVRARTPDAPMGEGIAAFADNAAAESFAERFGTKVLKFDELRVNVHLTMHLKP